MKPEKDPIYLYKECPRRGIQSQTPKKGPSDIDMKDLTLSRESDLRCLVVGEFVGVC